MHLVILTLHGLLCFVLIILVLLQQGKGADMGATLGGGSNTVFGAGGATDFITKLTTGIAVAFMATSILLVKMYASSGVSARSVANPLEGSVMMQGEASQAETSQGQPAPPATGANNPPPVKAEAQVVEGGKPNEIKMQVAPAAPDSGAPKVEAPKENPAAPASPGDKKPAAAKK